MNIYDFNAKNKKNEEVSLKEYEGKVLLIVNTATGCGFTPQYDELEKMYEEYKDQGFEILDFPCNQFGNQAPGSDEEISNFCTMKFGVKFPQFSKVDVNGENALPLFKFLQEQKGFEGFDRGNKLTPILKAMMLKSNRNYKNEPDIKWNFTKFAVDCKGNVVARFEPTKKLSEVEECIKSLLDERNSSN